MTRLALGSNLAIAFALAAVATVHAQGPDVQIVQLQCTGDPELVVIENLGDAPQEFPAGWELQSDPPESEYFDLSQLGGLLPGQSISIPSGPSASGVFTWDLGEFIFRDDDPTDYARIEDDTGAIVHQVNCGTEPTPTASPKPTPTPSPEPSPVNGVPNGGGPPPPPGNALSPTLMILMGGSLAAAGLATIARPWLRLRHSPPAAAPLPQEGSAGPRAHAQRRGGNYFRGTPFSPAFGLALMALAAAVVFLLVFIRKA